MPGQPRILRRFAPPPQPWLAGHRGIDLAAPVGTPVLAAGSGTIRFAGPVAGKGVVTIDHPNGLRTTYLPVKPSVSRGSQVTAGTEIGVIEDSQPHCQVSCLHWGLIRDSRYLNPLHLLGHAPTRLLPFWPQPSTRSTTPFRSASLSPGADPNVRALPHAAKGTRTPASALHQTTTTRKGRPDDEVAEPAYSEGTTPPTTSADAQYVPMPDPRTSAEDGQWTDTAQEEPANTGGETETTSKPQKLTATATGDSGRRPRTSVSTQQPIPTLMSAVTDPLTTVLAVTTFSATLLLITLRSHKHRGHRAAPHRSRAKGRHRKSRPHRSRDQRSRPQSRHRP